MGVYTALTCHWNMDSIALVDPLLGPIRYCELDSRVRKVATWLQSQGIQPGQVVCIQVPKSVFLLEFILGCLAHGSVVLPLNETYQLEQSLYYLRDSEAVLYIGPHEIGVLEQCQKISLEAYLNQLNRCVPLNQMPAISGDCLAMFLYTSGTTGVPKGAMISHDNILATVKGLHRLWGWTSKDVLLHVLPIFHVHGLVVAQFGALYAGATSVWMHRFESDMVEELIHKHRITVFMAVPTVYFRILETLDPAKLSSMRLFTSGSAPLPVRIHHRFENRYGFRILERYGMTEVGIVLSNPLHGERRIGTVGFPVGETQIRIVDLSTGRDCEPGCVGEIWISGPSVISGYWRRPEASAQTIQCGWLKSGDLGRKDADGYISIVGRSKDLIITGGLNVYPRDIERIFLECESVSEIAVVGLPNEEWGETVVGVIKGQSLDRDELRAASLQLAGYQRPKRWALVDDFPRNAMGKVQKAHLRHLLQNEPNRLFSLDTSVSHKE